MMSTWLSTSCRSSVLTKFGSMGDMPPKTHGRSGFTALMETAAALTILAKTCQPASISKSQCDLLLGSFQIMTASTNRSLLRTSGAPLANVNFFLGMIQDVEPRTAKHRLDTRTIRDPPVGAVSGVVMLNKVHSRKAILIEDIRLPERVIAFDGIHFLASTLHR